MADSMREFLESELQDTLSAERQALEGMESMLDAASSQSLRNAIQQHMQETERQIERLERVFGMLDMEEEGNTCEGMQGLVEEAEELIDDMEEGALLDVALLAAAQKVEHYEIAAYGTLCALLKASGHQEACDLLAQTLQEEKDTDERLTQLAEREINPAALQQDQAANDPSGRGGSSSAA